MDENWELKPYYDLKEGDIVLFSTQILYLHQKVDRRALFGPAIETTVIEDKKRSFLPGFADFEYTFRLGDRFWVVK